MSDRPEDLRDEPPDPRELPEELRDQPEHVRQFYRRGRSIQQVLQAVEDMLVDEGYDEIRVATPRGFFQWLTPERSRAKQAEGDQGELDRSSFPEITKQGRGVREVLEAVEDALIDHDFDDFVVAMERGSFHWTSRDQARAGRGEGDEPDATESD